jgi:hypothetical protein
MSDDSTRGLPVKGDSSPERFIYICQEISIIDVENDGFRFDQKTVTIRPGGCVSHKRLSERTHQDQRNNNRGCVAQFRVHGYPPFHLTVIVKGIEAAVVSDVALTAKLTVKGCGGWLEPEPQPEASKSRAENPRANPGRR